MVTLLVDQVINRDVISMSSRAGTLLNAVEASSHLVALSHHCFGYDR